MGAPRRKVRLHPEAHRDLAAGRDFYGESSPETAERFLLEVDAALALIQEAPERWAMYRLGMRRFVMPSFPYSIVYRPAASTIDVHAVAHAKRRPLYWRNRKF